MNATELILLGLLAIGVIGKNQSVSVAVGFLLLLRLLHINRLFPVLEQYGLQAGIVLLTIGVLSPIASGKIGVGEMVKTFTNWSSILAVAAGIAVAYLGGRGAAVLTANPLIVTGLMLGTILGVAFLKGVPVGPLIAGGITSLILSWVQKS